MAKDNEDGDNMNTETQKRRNYEKCVQIIEMAKEIADMLGEDRDVKFVKRASESYGKAVKI